MSHTEKILKDSTVYTISTVISQLLGIFTSIALRRFLTPEMMGIWTTFLVVLNYSLFTELGIFTAVQVRIPYLRGKDKEEEIQGIRNVAFTFAMIISLTMAAICVCVSLILAHSMPPYIILGIRILSGIIIATLFYNLYFVMLRADKAFSTLSNAITFNAFAMLVCTVTLGYFFNLKGIYIATLLATAASVLYVRFSTNYNLKLAFKTKLFLKLSKIGLPILVGGIIYTTLLSVDKIMIIKLIGAKELGFYSIAILAFTYTNTFPKLFGIVIFPTMQEEFGRSDSKERLLEYVTKPAIVTAYLFPALLGAAYFMLPLLVYYVLPKYIPGITSMKILLIGCFFASFITIVHNFIIALNKQIYIIYITIIAVILGFGINYVMIKMNYGINGVALGTSVTYWLYFIVLYGYSLLHCERLPKVYKFFLKIHLPFIYAASILVALEYCIQSGPVIYRIPGQAIIFFVLYSPMLFFINKQSGVLSKLLASWKRG